MVGFAAAGRALREPKSKLSRRISGLEERLGLRLIERSSRRFRVTETGHAFYERCRAMLAEADQAETLVMQAQAEPRGHIRFSCPTGMVAPVSDLITSFLARYPKVQLQLVATDRAVDLIEERIDVALRVRVALTTDAELTVRSVGQSVRILVASPQLASRVGSVEQLATLPTLSTNEEHAVVDWDLETGDGRRATGDGRRATGDGRRRKQMVRVEPRLGCTDMDQLIAAALAGPGRRTVAGPCLSSGVGRRALGSCAARLARSDRDRPPGVHDAARSASSSSCAD